jgi:glycosyltransferase involved in cell wall biosynthesis
VINDDLPAIYNLADCMVYPSLYEAFGLVQLEAMACGCPVVAANTGAIPEISGGAALLFDPLSAPEMAEKIVAILTESGLRQTYVERGLSRARDFTWERCARETLKVLQDAASN